MKGIEEIFNNIWDRREFADYLSRNEFTMLQEKVQTRIKELESENEELKERVRELETYINHSTEAIETLKPNVGMMLLSICYDGKKLLKQ